MKHFFKLLLGVATLPVSLFAQQSADSTASSWEKELELSEVTVIARRPVMKQEPDKIVYLIQNDQYAKGMDGLEVLDRIPRVSVADGNVTVAGKSSVRYIVDGHLLDIPENALTSYLRSLSSSGIEKIELLTTPPAKYDAGNNTAFISITTRNESLGTRGNLRGSTSLRESISYSLSGNISHTGRHFEMSAGLNWNDSNGINELDRTFLFADHSRTSDRITHFTWRTLGINGLLKYKINQSFGIGTILNFNMMPIETSLLDISFDDNTRLQSSCLSPAKPDNALTLTAFADWQLSSDGKTLNLTYNYFNRDIDSFSDITSLWDDGKDSHMTKTGNNLYRIHSVKLDATLPFSLLKLESGAAYTDISNATGLQVATLENDKWENDPSQSNNFNYRERTVAIYVSAEKNFPGNIFARVAARYEHTDLSGSQQINDLRHSDSYDYVFPTCNLSLNTNVGRFAADYSMGLNRPSFGDLNPFRYYTTVNDYFSGNPNLKASSLHNFGFNYSFKGIYTVLYCSLTRNAVGYLTRFDNNMQYTIPENCLNTCKAGIYASYNRSVFEWWNIKLGAEAFHSYAESTTPDFSQPHDRGWSGKLEMNSSWMLNRSKTLILGLHFTHYFPYRDRMIHYEARSLTGCDIRWMLLKNKLTLQATVNDPFGWNITKSNASYSDYRLLSENNIHSHTVSLRISYTFGGAKVNNVYRDSKERESSRSY